jgi:hypothetical protein
VGNKPRLAIAHVLSPDTSAVGNGNGTCIIPLIGKCTIFLFMEAGPCDELDG